MKMRVLDLLRVEVKRLLCSYITWIAILATFAAFLSGFYTQTGSTMASVYLAEQVKGVSNFGLIIFTILSLYELNRISKNNTKEITDCIVSPYRQALIRLLSLICVSLITTLLIMLLYAPFVIWKLNIVFSLKDYISCFLIYVFPSLAFGCIVSAICYQIIQRTDVSAILILVLVIGSKSTYFSESYLSKWSMPDLILLSDDFSNDMIFRLAGYNRLVWSLLLLGIWIISLLCIRRYGKNLFKSFVVGIKKGWLIALSMCLILGGCLLWYNEPFFDNSPLDWMNVEEKNYMVDDVFLVRVDANISINTSWLGKLKGEIKYILRNNTGVDQDFYLTLNSGYKVNRILINGQEIAFEDLKDDYIAARHIRCKLPSEEDLVMNVEYSGSPKLWNVMQSMAGGGTLISSNYIHLTGKSLAPVPEVLVEEDAPYYMQVELPKKLTPVANGYEVQKVSETNPKYNQWQTYDKGVTGMMVLAGEYIKINLNGGGMPIEFYYSKKHHEQIESLGAIQAMESAIRYCTEKYGARAFTEDRPFKIIQGTILMFGGFARDNISAISEDSFTAINLQNKDIGASGAEVLAHEIIHQWWGLGVMLMDPEDLYWSSEGIATYTTYRLMKQLYGDKYAKENYLDIWENSINNTKNNFYVRNPEYREKLPEKYLVNLDTTLRSVNTYSGYAMMFNRAAELLGGEDKLDEVLKKLFLEGGTEFPPYISLNDFLTVSGLTKEELGIE